MYSDWERLIQGLKCNTCRPLDFRPGARGIREGDPEPQRFRDLPGIAQQVRDTLWPGTQESWPHVPKDTLNSSVSRK